MLVQPMARLMSACTSFSKTAMLVGCAGRVGWKPDVVVLKRVFLITSFGGMAMAVLVALTSLTACSRPTPTQQVTLHIGVLRIQDDLPYFVM
jgi:hypothetical protein